MRINTNHRLVGDDGRTVPFETTSNKGGQLAAGKPEYLIIHYTAGGTADGAISWFKNSTSEASAHLVVGNNGAITQMVPFNTVAWHAGRSQWRGVVGLNRVAVGIEIVNWGLLQGEPGNWRNRVGGRVADERVLRARHKNFEPATLNGWETFDEDEVRATIAAAIAIVRHYAIPEANVLGHDDISPGRKQDPGPALDMERFRSQVFGRSEAADDLFEVASATGLNLRQGPGIGFAVIENLTDGRRVRRIGVDGIWFQVNTLDVAGAEDKTGWVHSRWLEPA